MQINLVSCVFVLKNEESKNIRKNDLKKIQILVSKDNELPKINVKENNIKEQVRKSISSILNTNIFHLEQVYAMDYKENIDIIYLGVTNIEKVDKYNDNYKLVDISIKNNNMIIFDNKKYKYKTIEIEKNNNIEYVHELECSDENICRTLTNILISYKRIRSNIDNTDILFKFMGDTFTLEDVRIVYELIKDKSVDKSNFRKRMVKYCEKTNDYVDTKKGYRPSQRYKFKPLKGDAWI